MTILTSPYGELDLEVYVDKFSAVDSYILRGYSVTLERDLTEKELDLIQEKYYDRVQEYAYSNGSRNHN